jgi:hypothetical protein
MTLKTVITVNNTAIKPEGPFSVTTINTGFPGDPGPPGPPGSGVENVESVKTADATLSGHRVVRSTGLNTVDYASASVLAQCKAVLGVTRDAVISGLQVQVVQVGEIVESSWNWAAGNVYLGENGLLTQTIPTSGNILKIGFSNAPTQLVVSIGEIITLS